MTRVDLAAVLKAITFPDDLWEWLDLLGNTIAHTEGEAVRQDAIFKADSDYKALLRALVHNQISTIKAIFVLLRMELTHQAAGQLRLYCESQITAKYISMDQVQRTEQFHGYSTIETYEAALAMLEWERNDANPIHVARLEQVVANLTLEYEAAKPRYTHPGRNHRRFSNWSGVSVAKQARLCGERYARLYHLIYSQMSAYVHGSSWSFRSVPAYSAGAYDVTVVKRDLVQLVNGTLAVWVEFCVFVDAELGWQLTGVANSVVHEAQLLAVTLDAPST